MIVFTVTVDTTGTGSHARLSTDESAEHSSVAPRVRGLRRYRRSADSDCLAALSDTAVDAVAAVLDGYRERSERWADAHCGCLRHGGAPEMGTLFDVV